MFQCQQSTSESIDEHNKVLTSTLWFVSYKTLSTVWFPSGWKFMLNGNMFSSIQKIFIWHIMNWLLHSCISAHPTTLLPSPQSNKPITPQTLSITILHYCSPVRSDLKTKFNICENIMGTHSLSILISILSAQWTIFVCSYSHYLCKGCSFSFRSFHLTKHYWK